jgi:glycerophosphoryl diester phosphodiesterase
VTTKQSEVAAPALSLIHSPRPLVIGHRGCCQFVPENTLPSFKMALAARVDLVELDYRHSKEGVPVVFHDPGLARTTDASRRWKRRHCTVAARTVAELQHLDAGKWFHPSFSGTKVPTLSEALDLIRQGSVALIERKAGDPATCLRLLRDKGMINHVVLQAFDWEYLRQCHELEPTQALAALGPARILPGGKRYLGLSRKLTAGWLRQAEKTGAKVVVWSEKVTRRGIELAHARGLRVWVYTVNKPRLANRLLRMGVDGLISDNPAIIWRALALR